MKIEEIINSNRQRQKLAALLNNKVGENVFHTYSDVEVKKLVLDVVSQSGTLSGIKNLEKLLLPPLDQELVKMIQDENPDQITILGREVNVEYRGAQSPRVRMDFCGSFKDQWKQLPQSLNLPGGRELVVISIIEGFGSYIESNSSTFKDKVTEVLNQRQWDRFLRSDNKPAINVPSLDESDMKFESTECQYGECSLTGEALMAYCGLSLQYHDRNEITSKWFRNKVEAQVAEYQVKALFAEKQKVVTVKLKSVTTKQVAKVDLSHGEDLVSLGSVFAKLGM